MALPILAAIGVALKAVVAWIIRYIIKWLIAQIILMLVVWLASDLIKRIVGVLSEEIKELNNFLRTKIFVVEDLFFRLQHSVYDAVRKIWTGIEEKIQSALDSLSPDQLEIVLKIVNFAAWVDTMITDISKSARDTVVTTVDIFTGPLVRKLESILNTLYEIELKISTAVRNLYDSITGAVQSQVDTFNMKISGLFADINSMLDWFNESIFEIHTAVETHNSGLPAKNAEIKAWVLNYLTPGTYTQAGIDAFAENLETRLQTTHTGLTTIDWDKYVYTLTPDINNYILTVIYPEFSFNLTELIPELGDMRTELMDIKNGLEKLPADSADRFMQLFPDFFRAQFETRLRQFMIIAITTMLLQKKNEISGYFGGITEQIEQSMNEGKAEIIRTTKQIIADIEEFELNIVKKLPDVLEPQLKKAVDEFQRQLAEKEDEVMVNIDNYVMDTTEIDHLVESFSALRKANPTPNKFDSTDWTIQDMYRMLVDYFSRDERIALIIYLASQDIEVNMSELNQIFPEPEEGDDPWADGNPFL